MPATNTVATLAPLNLTRTAAALIALDAADLALDSLTEGNACDATLVESLLRACDDGRDALGEAFALDTADRNRHEDAASWARRCPEDMRRMVAAFPPA